MSIIRRAILAFALVAGFSPAFAQAPPPVPALPDTERRTSYSISSSLCTCSVGFQLYGDSTDYANWLEVFVNGALIPQSGNWTITSPTGSLATIPRPITDAVLTFNAAQTGTVQIVGARRPRRTSQFSENRGVAARDLNQVLSDLTAQNRENWDKTNDVTGRAVLARPGETLALLPVLASRRNLGACFDSNGNLTSCASVPSSTIAAGNGILFTGTNPITISNNISAGAGIQITGTNPLVIGSTLAALSFTQTGTGAVADTMDAYLRRGIILPEQFGAVADCTTDDQAAIAAAITAAVAQNKTLVFDKTCYAHNGKLEFGFSDIRVEFRGQVTIKELGSTINVSIDGGACAGANCIIKNVQFGRGNPPILTGNSSSLNNLFARGIVHGSWIEAIGGDASTAQNGFLINYAVGSTFKLTYSNNLPNAGIAMSSKPSTAIVFTIRNAGETVTACDIYVIADAMVNGVALSGVVLSRIAGFAESNSGTGINLTNSTSNTFVGFDIENNGTNGIVFDTGASYNTFIGGSVATTGVGNALNINATANGNLFKGGQFNKLIVSDSALQNSFEDIQVISTFQPGITSTWRRVYNGSAVYYADRWMAPIAISTLTPCSATYEGGTMAVSDSSVTTWGTTVSGGGANHVMVYCNGTNWTVAGK